MRQTDETFNYIFDGKSSLLASSMEDWLNSSRRFAAFVDSFRDKIRKKIRVTQDPESLLDLRLEFETAYLLLREARLSLLYEPQLSEKIRGPDFAVTFTTSLTFMLEVTRLRAEPGDLTSDLTQSMERLADAVCSKLGQMQHQLSNVLIVGVDTLHPTEGDLRGMMLRIQQRAEHGDTAFFQRYGFRDRADFFRHYQRLSEILIRTSNLEARGPILTCINSQAKYPLPGKVRTVLYRSQTV
jgi:hypothetical protein